MGAKSLCIPFEQPKGEHALVPGKTKCTQCGLDAKVCPVCSCPTECVLITVLALALHALWKILLVGGRLSGSVSLVFVSSFRSGACFQCIPETQSRHRMPKHYTRERVILGQSSVRCALGVSAFGSLRRFPAVAVC